eukprot:g4897.t1
MQFASEGDAGAGGAGDDGDGSRAERPTSPYSFSGRTSPASQRRTIEAAADAAIAALDQGADPPVGERPKLVIGEVRPPAEDAPTPPVEAAGGQRDDAPIQRTVSAGQLLRDEFRELLFDSDRRFRFGQHMAKEFCRENLDFWEEAQAFGLGYAPDGAELDEASLHQHAHRIYRTFVHKDAEQMINLGSSVVSTIEDKLKAADGERAGGEKDGGEDGGSGGSGGDGGGGGGNDEATLTADLFCAAQEEVFTLMVKDSYQRFRGTLASVSPSSSQRSLGGVTAGTGGGGGGKSPGKSTGSPRSPLRRLLSGSSSSSSGGGSSSDECKGEADAEVLAAHRERSESRGKDPEVLKRDLKLAQVLGDVELIGSERIRERFGSFMSAEAKDAMKKAEMRDDKRKAKEAGKAAAEVVKAKPSEQHLAHPTGKTKLRPKALEIMGDSYLKAQDDELVHPGGNVKAAKVLGTMRASGNDKIRERFGSFMDDGQVRAMIDSDKKEAAARKSHVDKATKGVLNLRSASIEQRTSALEPEKADRVSDKAVGMMGEEELVEANKGLVPKDAAGQTKAAKLTGEMAIHSKKVRQRLGSFMHPDQMALMRAADSKDEADRRRSGEQHVAAVLASKPTGDQLKHPTKKNLGPKALRLMGSSFLIKEDASKGAVGTGSGGVKAAKVLGTMRASGNDKIRERFGSFMSEDQIRAMKDAEKKEEEERLRAANRQKKEVLTLRRTSQEQRELPPPGEILGRVGDKAIDMMGDDELVEANKQRVHAEAVGQAKAAKLTGEMAIHSKKVRQRLGSFMKPDQMALMRASEAKEEEQRRKAGKKTTKTVIKSQVKEEQLAHPQQVSQSSPESIVSC